MRTGIRQLYLKRLLGQARRYKLLLGLTLGAGLLNLGLTFVIPWLIGSAIDRVIARDYLREGVAPPMTAAEVAADFQLRIDRLFVIVAIGVGTALLFGIITYVRGHYTVKLGNRIIADLRRDLFEHLQRLSLHFYSKERTGSIVSRLINDIQQAGNLINGGVLLVVMDFIQTIVAAGLLIAISWKLTLACIGILPLYVLTFRVFNERVRVASDRVQSQISKISGTVQEKLSGIALVKANDGEEREKRRFVEETEEHFGRVVEQSSIAHLVGAISETLVHCGTVIIIGYGSYLALRREMSAGDITRFLGYLGIMYGPVRRFADLNIVYQTSMAALDRVFRVLDITPRITEHWRAVGTAPSHGEVRFEHVKFCYEDDSEESRVSLDAEPTPEEDKATADRPRPCPAKHWVLDDLDFTVAAGQRVALVGPSGSGKSTIVSLLPRLYDVGEGRVVIDGVDVRDYRLSALRQSIAIVQQDSFVFTGTIRENLVYGRPNATDEEVVEAAKAANAHDFISALPDGYQTMLGERGVNLSGGQRQRLSIARALLKNPRVLILDEATSALDTVSEALVQNALEHLMEGRTSFIIAHRLSTVRTADRIFVLEKGKVVESGTHDELVEQGGLYAELVRRQFGVESPQETNSDQPVRVPATIG
jgi:subfamily B ATP-binding cassette protein MsbA